ncbi:ATP-dependent DNA ligase [Nakamurella sp. GG22]
MAGDSATIELDGHRLALTRLRKVLYPATGTTKSDVIAYFAEVAHAMIPHLAGRPVTRKRWPDGVSTTPFFHKDLGRGAPSWVTRRVIVHSDGPKAYPVVDSPATLAWFGQIAALELHVPQWRFPELDPDSESAELDEAGFDSAHPDRVVFDLDPGPGVGLAECAVVARAVRSRMAGAPLVPVTSGSKGIHLYGRLDGTMTSDDASQFAREIAEAIEQDMPGKVVSRMAKALRPGKIFIDWSQNNASKTTIAPYSLRGRDRPTVAAPRTWEELEDPELRHLDYSEVVALLAEAPDPMQGLETGDNAGAEHRARPGRRRVGSHDSARATSHPEPHPEPREEVPDRKLDKYRSMRSAAKTPEPVPEPGFLPHGNDNTFVIQEHHARRLHYDFRLERGGVLVSWAVPKNIPADTGQNRLAVQTEDHPLDYADFAGIIPRGEYGGGTVTIWDAGTYTTEKWRDDEVMIVLNGQKARGRYVLIRTKDNSWLMHRMKDQTADGPAYLRKVEKATGPPEPPHDLAPMLATAATVQQFSDDDSWRFEGKWDGIRAIATFGPRGLTLRSRAGNDFTHAYPELQELTELMAGHSGVLDGEIVALEPDGRSSFHLLQQRMNLAAARDVARVRQKVSVQFWLFDVLHLDGVSLLDKRYDDRRRILEVLPISGEICHVPPQLPGPVGEALQHSLELKWEGIVAKKGDSTYLPGKRSRSWLKIKNFLDVEVAIVGWRPGAGRRAGSLGALLVAVPDADGRLRYAGKVGTGFTDVVLDQLMNTLKPLRRSTSPVADTVPRVDARDANWVEPTLVGEVTYTEWTPDGRLRAPSWRGLRPDKSVADLPQRVTRS